MSTFLRFYECVLLYSRPPDSRAVAIANAAISSLRFTLMPHSALSCQSISSSVVGRLKILLGRVSDVSDFTPCSIMPLYLLGNI